MISHNEYNVINNNEIEVAIKILTVWVRQNYK